MVRYRNKRHSSDFARRLIAMWTVLSMLLSNFATLAENTLEGSDIQTAAEDAGWHEHTEACYENILVCGQEEAESEKEFQSTFAVHHHSGSCYDAAGNLSCGLIENEYYHTHNEFCRNAEGQLVCGLETRRPHEHTEDCYRTDRSLICEKQETEGHAHGDACYRENRELVCGIEESEGHTHGEECYVERRELSCGLEENEDHVHNDSCYTVTRELVCEKEEKPGHAHSDDCWQVTRELVCEKPEEEPHFHGDSCYEETKTLICEKTTTTHHHTASCFNEQGLATCGQWEVPTFTCTEENWVEVGGHHHDESCYEKKLVCGLEGEYYQADGGEPVSADQTNPEDDLVAAKEDSDQTTDSAADASSDTDQQTDQSADGQQPESGTNIPDQHDNDTPAATVGSGTESPAEPENSNENLVPEFEINDTILAKYNGCDEIVTVPDGITQIDVRAFNGNTAIRKVILPDSVELINSSAFADCPNLEQVVLSDQSKLSLIGMAAFKNDKKLDTSFAANVAHVVENAFVGIGDEEESGKEEEPTGTDAGDSEKSISQEEFEVSEGKEETDNQEESKDPEDQKGTEESEEPEDLNTSEEQKESEDSEDNSEQKDSEDSEENNEQKEQEDPEKPDEQKEPEDPEASEEQEDPEASGEQNESERTIAVADDAPIQAYITFSSEAGIPEGTQFVVEESAENANIEPQAQPVKLKSASRKAVLQKSRGAEDPSETYASIPSLTVLTEGESLPDIVLYEKTLNISLVSDGKEIEPENPEAEIKVTVILPGIEKGQQVEVRHVTDEGEILLDSTNDGEVVTFTTSSFSLFTFTSSAQKIFSKTSEWLDYTLFGRSTDQTATLENAKIDENSLPDGFSIIDTTSSPQNSNLWMTLQRVKDIALGKLESIDLYAVVDGKLAGIVKENVGITDILRLNLGNYSSFALVRDSGLRSKVEELGNVILSGLMPKNGTAEAVDVTDEYAEFVVGQGASKDREADEELGGLGGNKEGEAAETLGGEGSDKQGETVRTIAAYDISIINDGEEYQPEDKPIEVTIKDEAIATAVANGNSINLWHVLDDGTAEQVENFTITGDTVVFDATGFSVYVLTETTVEKILTAADGKVYRITVTYDGSAQIPEGAELVVNEVDEGDYLASTATALGVDESYLLYRKFLDISFVTAEGEIVEPAAPVSVKIELLDVEAGADKLQVVHFGEDGAEKVEASSSDNAIITFSSDSFSVFGFGNVLEPLATTETDEVSVEILGFSADTQLVGTDVPEVEEGLEVLGAYSLDNVNKVWIKAELKDDAELSSMESVAIYMVKDSTGEDETGKTVEELAGMDTITELPTTEFAVVKDSGYRHLSFELNVDEENDGNEEKTVSLDGMMPKAAEAAAVDVTENYTDHSFTESAPIYNEETPSVDGEENEETGAETTPVDEVVEDAGTDEETADEAVESVDKAEQRIVVAAFDISIQNGDNDYQPDEEHPVEVTINDSRILPNNNIELWHIRNDGSQERVEDCTIADGTVSFTATGFSTYAIVYNITTYYQTSSGETYKITVEYGDDAGLPEDVELRVTEVDSQEYLADTATTLGTTDPYLYYNKFLDISFVVIGEDGEEKTIEPNAPVSVKIELQDVTAGAEKLQVVHFGADGAEKVDSQANSDAVVSFESKNFSVFGIGNVLTPLATAETDEANIEILGFGGEAEISTTATPAVEEGLEVLGAYTIGDETGNKLWIKADVKDGVELSALESVAIYTVGGENSVEEAEEETAGQDSEAGEENIEEEQNNTTQLSELTTAGNVAELTVSEFALVKDSGYRHLSFEISVGDEETQAGEENAEGQEAIEAGKIILDGMMPKMATAEAVDVTDAYADHEYVVPEEEQVEEEQGTPEEITDSEEAPEEQPVSDEEMPAEEAQDGVEEVEESQNDTKVEEQKRTTLAAFNITISNNDSEYQPDEDHPISVEIRDRRITGENVELWHIKDDGTEERVVEFTVEDGRIEFTATGFSVYTIVEAPEPPQIQAGNAQTVAELDGNSYYLKVYRNNATIQYLTNTKGTGGYSNRIMFSSPPSSDDNPSSGSLYHFEKVEGQTNQFYLSTVDSQNNTVYVKNASKDVFSFESDKNNATVFIVELYDDSTQGYFKIYTGTNITNMIWTLRGGGQQLQNGGKDDYRSKFILYKPGTVPNDPYELDGKTYSIVYHEESVKAAALTSNSITYNGKACLDYQELLVRPNVVDDSGELLIAKDADLREWTFENISGAEYKISTTVGAKTYYIRLENEDLKITDIEANATPITVTAGTGEYSGKYNFSYNGYSITHIGDTSGTTQEWFKGSNTGGKKSWLNLATRSSILTDEDFTVYSAEKVDLSDRTVVPDGSTVVVYTRKWNDAEKKYEFYVVGHDGSVMRAYESGDVIQWVGSNISTAEWDFTEYHYDDGTPNYYYELQNTYSGQYIAPQVSGDQILQGSTIGINLNGRRYGYYYSTILAWDDDYYSYVGLKLKNDRSKIVSCPMSEAEQFYFAILKPVSDTDELTTVTTVDNVAHGITVKMIDWDQGSMNRVLVGTSGTPLTGLLSTNLTNGYPTAVRSGQSLGNLYSGATSVNHLFIENTYYSSGYYEFDSTQNFASFYRLNDDGTYTYDGSNFTVYHQLGTHEKSTTSTIKHGQFLPYNYIVAGQYSTLNPLNLYSALADYRDPSKGVLPDSDPRKGEQLHLVEGDPDFYFAMELEATFTQTLSGLDAWGHDIIYEFTGDDDFWLYVDGELIIDLGGTHSALAGSVNYRTGNVTVNGTTKTLRQIFKDNYEGRNPGATTDEVNAYLAQYFEEGEVIFKDYSQHTMKIFYMERGAGASNLHMRFNLASVKPGTVELSKQISGVDDTESFMAEYPFQIFFKSSETGAVEQQLETLSGAAEGISVKYKDSTRDVTYKPSFTTSDGSKTYSHVYMLKPGETAVIDFPDNTYEYRIVECFLNTEVYEYVNVNGDPVEGTEVLDTNNEVVDDRKDYDSGYAEVSSREKVTFDNHVIAGAKGTLTFKKLLYNENGVGEGNRIYHTDTDAAFRFRLYLGTENDSELPPANMHSYHVKDENGNYCKWVSGTGFVSLNTSDLSTLSTADKTAATFYTSMNGTTDKIPVDYTVEVREIPAGTKYRVEERYREVPDGYSLLRYLVYDADTSSYQETGNNGKNVPEGIISAVNPNAIEIDNMKGWGIRVQKTWSDAEWMQDRDSVYFALYENNNGNYTLVSNSVTQLSYGEDSVYWFIQTLNDVNGDGSKNEEDFKLYEPHEVIISSSTPTVDEETGIVTNYGSITSILNVNGTYTINGKQIGETSSATYTYVVLSYEKGELADGSNVRVDTITNKRAGIELYKRAWDGTTPLAGAVFKLTYMDGGEEKNAGAETYTSDGTGYITTAYLQEGREYTLTEIASPNGYQGIQTALIISRTGNTISVRNAETTGWTKEQDSNDSNKYYGKNNGYTWWTSDDTDVIQNTTGSLSSIDVRIGQIDIRNKPYTLQFVKTEPENNGPLAGVTFALYPQAISSSGEPRRDYLPVDGYESLVTDSNGVIPQLTADFANGTLDPGTYYLYEVSTLPQYRPLSEDVKFTVSETGTVTIDSAPSGVTIASTDGNTAVENVVTIPNALAGTVEWLYVKKVVANVTWEDKHTFDFRATLYLPDGITPWNFTNEDPDSLPAPFINGVANFSMTDYDPVKNNLVLLKVPLGAVVKVTEEPTIAYTTTAVLSNYGAAESTTTCEYNSNNRTSTVTINDNVAVLLTYTNTRRFENVTVKKQLDNNDPDKTGRFAFTGKLMDYDVDITEHITGLKNFSIDVNNRTGTIVFSMPVRSELTVTEQPTTDQAAMYTTTYSPANGILNVTGASTLTVTNTRKKQTVTITKELHDESASGAVSFPFTVTLYNPDQSDTYNSYQMYSQNGTTIKTGDGKNGTTKGVATFNLSVTNYVDENDTGIASQTLTVPYGAVLKIEEGEVTGGNTYSTVIAETSGSSTMTTSDKTAYVTVTDNPTIKYTNTLLEGNADLTITKTVEDLATGSTAGEFTFTVSGLNASTSYDFTPQVYDGTDWGAYTGSDWEDGLLSSKETDANGVLTFTLLHNTRVKISVLVGSTVTVTETNSGGFSPSYSVTHGATGTPGSSVSSNSAQITMNGIKTIDFTNTKGVVAPTNFSTRHIPWLLLLLFGLMLLIGGGVAVKRRRGDDGPEDDGTIAMDCANTDPPGPPGNAPPQPLTILRPTYSTTDSVSHIRWRNSVWVEEHPQRCGYNPTSRRGYIPPRKTVTCPQARLWMNGGGDAG